MVNKNLRKIVRYRIESKYDAAIAAALSAYSIFKDNCYLNQVYICYKEQDRKKDAINILKKMINNEPDSLILHKSLAFDYFCLGEFKDSLKYYKKILDIEPNISQNYFNAGCTLHYMNKPKEAKKYYEKALIIDKNNISALNNLGLLYYENDKWECALSLFERAIKISPTHPEAYHHIGIIYRKYKNDLDLSKLYLKKAIRLDPKHAENYYELGLTYYIQNKLEDAKDALSKCTELKPSHKESIKLLKKLAK